ncbi:hypothetical protein Tco_1146303 [Tanacetum coccineum]
MTQRCKWKSRGWRVNEGNVVPGDGHDVVTGMELPGGKPDDVDLTDGFIANGLNEFDGVVVKDVFDEELKGGKMDDDDFTADEFIANGLNGAVVFLVISSSTVVGAYEGDGVPVVDERPNGVRVDEKAGEVPDGLNGLKDGVPNNVGVEDDDDDVVWLNGLKDGVPTSVGHHRHQHCLALHLLLDLVKPRHHYLPHQHCLALHLLLDLVKPHHHYLPHQHCLALHLIRGLIKQRHHLRHQHCLVLHLLLDLVKPHHHYLPHQHWLALHLLAHSTKQHHHHHLPHQHDDVVWLNGLKDGVPTSVGVVDNDDEV